MTAYTRKVLKEMFTENTGKHFLDSGDYYGRNYERNQLIDLDAQPAVTLSLRHGIEFTLNAYHYCCEHLEYNEDAQAVFERWVSMTETREDEEMHWFEAARRYIEVLVRDRGAAGIYGEGDPICVNTYNEENLLDQTLQFWYWEDGCGAHVLLQVHGGCDVRGGYTRPRIFDVDSYEGVDFLCNYRGGGMHGIWAEALDGSGEITHWTTDDAYHWYNEGSCGLGAGRQLEEYATVTLERLMEEDAEHAKPVVWRDEHSLKLFEDDTPRETLSLYEVTHPFRDEDGCLDSDTIVVDEENDRAYVCVNGVICELKAG